MDDDKKNGAALITAPTAFQGGPSTPAAALVPGVVSPTIDANSLIDSLVAGQLSPRTRAAYAGDLTEFLGALEQWGLSLGEVTRDDLLAYRSWLSGESVEGLIAKPSPLAPASVSRKVSVLRQLFAEALDRGLVPLNPAARLRGFQLSGESKTNGFTKEQARRLLEAIDASDLPGLRDRAMLSLMLRTGLRRMDVIQASVGSLDTVQGYRVLRVTKSKGAKDRTVKIPVDVGRDLDAWLEAARLCRVESPSTPLFCGLVKSGRGKACIYKVYEGGQKPLSEKAVWLIVRARALGAGIEERVSPHSTRHAFITLALDGGAPLHKVQVAAGHADPRTTERYWRTQQNLDDNAVDYIRLGVSPGTGE